MKLKIKICGLIDPKNTKDIIKLKPEFLGFNFYPSSPRYVGNAPGWIAELLPAGILKVGVFVNENADTIIGITQRYKLDMVQLHGSESEEVCKVVRAHFPVMKALGVGDSFPLEEVRKYEEVCDFYLFDCKTPAFGGSGKKFNWEVLADNPFSKPYFIGGGLSAEDGPLLKTFSGRFTNMVGIELNSRFELEPGIKNTKVIQKFIAQNENSKTS